MEKYYQNMIIIEWQAGDRTCVTAIGGGECKWAYLASSSCELDVFGRHVFDVGQTTTRGAIHERT